jgi:hypothetical protein
MIRRIKIFTNPAAGGNEDVIIYTQETREDTLGRKVGP